MIVLILAILGLCFGSFINALVWRVHEQENGQKGRDVSVLKGRSMCPNCRHELAAQDLVPVFSWLFLRGRCRYCKKPIAWQYPLVELATAAIFVLSYLWWPISFDQKGQWLLLSSWLAAVIGLMALLIYDFRWMLLPNRILYPTFLVVAASRMAYILAYAPDKTHQLSLWGASLIVASGFFAAIFYASKGRWIGFGDVRLGLVTGTVLATPGKSVLMLFLASVLGTLFILPAVASGKSKMTSRMPYGPFLITATAIVVLFGQSFLDWYQRHFL